MATSRAKEGLRQHFALMFSLHIHFGDFLGVGGCFCLLSFIATLLIFGELKSGGWKVRGILFREPVMKSVCLFAKGRHFVPC